METPTMYMAPPRPPSRPVGPKMPPKECEHKFKFIEATDYTYVFFCEKCLKIERKEKF